MGSIQYLNERDGTCTSCSNLHHHYKGTYRNPPDSWNRLSLSTPTSATEVVSPQFPGYKNKYNPNPADLGGGGDNLVINASSCHQLGKDRIQFQFPSGPQDYIRSSNLIKEWEDMVKEKREKIILAKRSSCKFCDKTDKNGVCQCPIHLPAVHSRYMRVLEDRSRNSVAIYVFKNGENRVAPVLIQIPRRCMHSMEDTMKVIEQSVKFPVGYAHGLFTLGGDMIYEPSEIKPYENYVVVNNIKRQFVHMEYGNTKPENAYMRRRRRFYPGAFNVSISHYNRQ